MLTYRSILAKAGGIGLALMLVALACGCGGGGGGGGDNGGGGNPPASSDTTAPIVSAPLANPASLSPLGGQVTIQVKATDNVAVSSVSAVITGFDPSTQLPGARTVNLSRTPGTTTTWSAQSQVPAFVTYPANVANAAGEATYSISFTATDSSGNRSQPVPISFVVTGLAPFGP